MQHKKIDPLAYNICGARGNKPQNDAYRQYLAVRVQRHPNSEFRDPPLTTMISRVIHDPEICRGRAQAHAIGIEQMIKPKYS
jgi:hypothetical protein